MGVAEAAADAGADGIIDMGQFLRSKGMIGRCNKAVNPTAMPLGFKRLDEAGIAEYIVRLPRYHAFFTAPSPDALSNTYTNAPYNAPSDTSPNTPSNPNPNPNPPSICTIQSSSHTGG